VKHNIGDLVAILDYNTKKINLGYISRINKTGDLQGYFVYFFHWSKNIWYSEDYVDAFKSTLERWKIGEV
jgi:hypothetical protein